MLNKTVLYRHSYSKVNTLHSGVPQGSVLGPLLFLIYVNDVADNMLTFCRLFADDSSFQDSSNNLKFIKNNLHKDLTKLEK